MLHFYKFHEDIPAPSPARETYQQRRPGKGWPEECPPLRAANAFGWDILAPFAMRFRRQDGRWTLEDPVDLESDWLWHGGATGGDEESGEGAPLVQRNAWFWEEGQELPHRITPEVYEELVHQVKVSTYLFLRTDANELLYLTDIPNVARPWRAVSVLLDTDWYPASYPWHCVLELDPRQETVEIPQGEPIARMFLVRRDTYFAREMTTAEFEAFFERGQEWLRRWGRGESHDMRDITRTYVKQQRRSSFDVIL